MIDPALLRPEAISDEIRAQNAEIVRKLSGLPDPWLYPTALVRERRRQGLGPFPDLPRSPRAETLAVEGRGGAIPLRVIAPENPRGVYYHIHGGGWSLGAADEQDPWLERIAESCGLACVSVEYRLAPEHVFPAYLDDAHDSYTWARTHGRELGGDGRIVVGGDSAGGNLAAVVAQERRGSEAPDAQLLIYPSVDTSRRRRSHELFGEGFFLTDTLMEWYAGHFMGPGADPADPRRSPLLAPDLSGLAPALVVTAGFDPLRDEGEAYAAALGAAGVRVLTRRFTGLFHTFINCVGISPACRAAMAEVGGMLRALLATA
jgi:acetyl esterase/lipase